MHTQRLKASELTSLQQKNEQTSLLDLIVFLEKYRFVLNTNPRICLNWKDK